MIIVPRTPEQIKLFHDTMEENGMRIRTSGDLRFLGHAPFGSTEIDAIAAYGCFIGATCGLTLLGISKRWLDKDFLFAMYHYPFVVCECVAMFTHIATDNEASLRLNKRMGFKPIKTIVNGYAPGVHLQISELLREDCKWISQKFARKLRLVA